MTEDTGKAKRTKTVKYTLDVVDDLPAHAARTQSGPRGYYKLLLQVIGLDTQSWVQLARFDNRQSAAITLRTINKSVQEKGAKVALPEVPDGGWFEFETRRLEDGSALYVRTCWNIDVPSEELDTPEDDELVDTPE